jgi:hypothetical protein
MDAERTAAEVGHASPKERAWPRPRDLMVLRWACEQYGARLDHIAALIERSEEAARLTLIRLRSAGFVDKRRFVVGERPWMLPTAKGLALAGLSGVPWDPSVTRLARAAAINEVRLQVQRRRPDAGWIAARRLRSEGPEGRGYVRNLPDGVVLMDGKRVAIKVELYYRPEKMPPLLDELERGHDETVCFCSEEALREMRQLAECGRWRSLRLRELPRLEAKARADGWKGGL